MSKEQQILMLGILSIVGCSVCGPFAWIQANDALSLIDQGGYDPIERNLVAVGKVCGIIGTGFLALEVFVVIVRAATGGH